MRKKITAQLVQSILPQDRPLEVYDPELKGFVLRVQPTGNKSYLVRYRRRDGRQTRKKLGSHPTLSPGMAREAARQALARVIRGEDLQARPVRQETLRSFIGRPSDPDSYSHWLQAHHKHPELTAKRLRTNFAEFMDRPLEGVTAGQVDRWRTRRMNAGASSATVNRDIASLRGMFSRAVEWGVISVHPLSGLKTLKVDTQPIVRYLTSEEMERLISALERRETQLASARESADMWRRERGYPELGPKCDRLRTMVILSLKTGLRFGELTALRWADVDMSRAILTVRGTNAKSGKTRYVPLSPEALHVMKAWAPDPRIERELVFPGEDGNKIVDIKTAWSRVLREAGIKNFRWHDLRHSFASKLVQAGVDLNTTRELLGHGDLAMTLRYSHLAPQQKVAAVAKLDQL